MSHALRAPLIALLLLGAGLGVPTGAEAAEVRIDGFYRARGRFFDTLSLNRSLAESVGSQGLFQHRLLLRPKLLASDRAGVYVDIMALDGLRWGDYDPGRTDEVSGQPIPSLLRDDLTTTSSVDGATSALGDNLVLRHAWGEVHTDVLTLRVGRMPLHWGSGIWLNDGYGWNADFGDRADRIQLEAAVDAVYIMGAFDLNALGGDGTTDTTVSINLAGAYRTETIEGGGYVQIRTVPDRNTTIVNASLAGDVELGFLDLDLEVVGRFGGGDLGDGRNDVNLAGFGGILHAGADLGVWPGIEGASFDLTTGFATGDGDPNDDVDASFTLDRDVNVGLLLFEQVLPQVDTGTSVAQVGHGVTNAFFVQPRIGWKPIDPLRLEVGLVYATALATPEGAPNQGDYGTEIDLGATWTPADKVTIFGNAALLLPGPYLSDYADDTYDASTFSEPAFGLQLITRFDF